MPTANPPALPPPGAAGLGPDADQAEIILRANYRNLVQKVHRGKTLSAGEVNILESIRAGQSAEGSRFARNKVALAKSLGVHRRTLAKYQKHPKAPAVRPNGGYDVPAWRAFLVGQGLDLNGAGSDDIGATQSELRARQIALQNGRLEQQYAIAQRDWVPVVDVRQWGAELGSAIRKVVLQIHLAAPALVGLDTAGIEARLKESEDEILRQLTELPARIERWRRIPAA